MLTRLENLSIIECILYLNLFNLFKIILSLSLDKSGALDSLSAQVHCDRDLLQ